jgi:hypothetical protein
MPTAAPGSISQTTLPSPGNPVPAAPQQSVVLRQRSPFTWQPLAGWHTFTPVGPYGAQRRLQHPLQASHSVPSTPSLQYVAPLGTGPHFPSVAPVAIWQIPLQQEGEFEQVSPDWTQNDGVPQTPAVVQYFEQHSAEPPQALPADLHVALIGTHFPPEQLPPQHWALLVQAPLSETHCDPHMPLTQLRVAHWVGDVHPPPGCTFTISVQVWAVGSHFMEQH